MPSKSAKQRRFMAAAANNPEFAAKAGIDQSVAQEFHAADEMATTTTDNYRRKRRKPKGAKLTDAITGAMARTKFTM